jgi:hypothetical protein
MRDFRHRGKPLLPGVSWVGVARRSRWGRGHGSTRSGRGGLRAVRHARGAWSFGALRRARDAGRRGSRHSAAAGGTAWAKATAQPAAGERALSVWDAHGMDPVPRVGSRTTRRHPRARDWLLHRPCVCGRQEYRWRSGIRDNAASPPLPRADVSIENSATGCWFCVRWPSASPRGGKTGSVTSASASRGDLLALRPNGKSEQAEARNVRGSASQRVSPESADTLGFSPPAVERARAGLSARLAGAVR